MTGERVSGSFRCRPESVGRGQASREDQKVGERFQTDVQKKCEDIVPPPPPHTHTFFF